MTAPTVPPDVQRSDVPPPRRPRSAAGPVVEVLFAAAALAGSLAATWFATRWTGSTLAGIVAGAAVIGPVLVWSIRRARRATFFGLRAFAIAVPALVACAVAAPAVWKWLRPPAPPALRTPRVRPRTPFPGGRPVSIDRVGTPAPAESPWRASDVAPRPQR